MDRFVCDFHEFAPRGPIGWRPCPSFHQPSPASLYLPSRTFCSHRPGPASFLAILVHLGRHAPWYATPSCPARLRPNTSRSHPPPRRLPHARRLPPLFHAGTHPRVASWQRPRTISIDPSPTPVMMPPNCWLSFAAALPCHRFFAHFASAIFCFFSSARSLAPASFERPAPFFDKWTAPSVSRSSSGRSAASSLCSARSRMPSSPPPTPKQAASIATFAMDLAASQLSSTAGVFFSSSPAAPWPHSRALSANISQELFRFLSQDRRSLPSW